MSRRSYGGPRGRLESRVVGRAPIAFPRNAAPGPMCVQVLHPPDPLRRKSAVRWLRGLARWRRHPRCHGKAGQVRSELPGFRVFLVDEQEVVRRGVAKVLEGDTALEVVGEAGSVSEALRRAPAVRPDVAVVAMRFPDGSGAHLCERLLALFPGLRLLVLSDSMANGLVQAAMRAGASGYLGKHVSGAVLLAAVRSVASGNTVVDGEAAALSGQRADAHGDRLALLACRERAVLRLIGEGLPNREIAE